MNRSYRKQRVVWALVAVVSLFVGVAWAAGTNFIIPLYNDTLHKRALTFDYSSTYVTNTTTNGSIAGMKNYFNAPFDYTPVGSGLSVTNADMANTSFWLTGYPVDGSSVVGKFLPNALAISRAGDTITQGGMEFNSTAASFFEKWGPGTLIFMGDNQAGAMGTDVREGTLQVGNAAAIGTGYVAVYSGATLEINVDLSRSTLGIISADGVFPAGEVKINSGKKFVVGRLSGYGKVGVAGTLEVDSASDISLYGILSGAGSVKIKHSGTVDIDTTSFTGTIATENNLTLTTAHAKGFGSRLFDLGAATGNKLVYKDQSGTTMKNEVIPTKFKATSGSNSIKYDLGSRTLTVTADNSGFIGSTQVASGTLTVSGSAARLGADASALTVDSGATLAFSKAAITAGAVEINGKINFDLTSGASTFKANTLKFGSNAAIDISIDVLPTSDILVSSNAITGTPKIVISSGFAASIVDGEKLVITKDGTTSALGELSPPTGSYDGSSPSALSFTLDSATEAIKDLSSFGVVLESPSGVHYPLSKGTGYILSGSTLTLPKEILAALANGVYTLYTMDGSMPIAKATITIKGNSGTVSMSPAQFDGLNRVNITLTLGGTAAAAKEMSSFSLVVHREGGTSTTVTLRKNLDYTVSGGTVTIMKEFFARLANGKYTLNVLNFGEQLAKTEFSVVNNSNSGGGSSGTGGGGGGCNAGLLPLAWVLLVPLALFYKKD